MISFPLKHSKISKIVQTGVLYALVGLCLQYTMEHNLNTHQVQSTFHFEFPRSTQSAIELSVVDLSDYTVTTTLFIYIYHKSTTLTTLSSN